MGPIRTAIAVEKYSHVLGFRALGFWGPGLNIVA